MNLFSGTGRSIGVRQALADADPNDTGRRSLLANSLNILGLALESAGDAERALSNYRLGEEMLDRLVSRDPSNSDWRATLAAIACTSGSGSGGSQRFSLTAVRAAAISASPNPLRLNVPAMLARVLLRSPLRMISLTSGGRCPFCINFLNTSGKCAGRISPGPCPTSHSYRRPETCKLGGATM